MKFTFKTVLLNKKFIKFSGSEFEDYRISLVFSHTILNDINCLTLKIIALVSAKTIESHAIMTSLKNQ